MKNKNLKTLSERKKRQLEKKRLKKEERRKKNRRKRLDRLIVGTYFSIFLYVFIKEFKNERKGKNL